MKPTQKNKIYNYLKNNPTWFKSYELQAKALEFGASPATVDRRLRDLVAEGGVERRRAGRYEEYRIKDQRPSYDMIIIDEASELEAVKLFTLPTKRNIGE